MRRLLITLVMVICMTQASCVRFARYRPVDEKSAVVLFDRYEVFAGAGIVDSSLLINLTCQVSFAEDIPSSVPADTIPVLVIDSVCLHGPCLGQDRCLLSPHAAELKRIFSARKGGAGEGEVMKPDLRDVYGRYELAWFDFFDRIRLPNACLNQTMETVIYACPLDRRTGVVVGREIRKVPSMIKRYKRPQLLS